jgi:1-phosphofructokinase family hexose kinase
MILCLTPNPALDRTLTVPGFKPGEVFRATQTLVAPGGKGLNLARSARILGGDVRCVGFLGGHNGRLLAELAEKEGLDGVWTWIEGETRVGVVTIDPELGTVTKLYQRGPQVSAADWARLRENIEQQIPHADCICFSGSLPPGSPLERFREIVQRLGETGKPVWIDTSGEALQTALETQPAGIKVNGGEAGAVIGRSIESPGTALEAANELRRRGIENVVLTLGEQGAVAASNEGNWWAQPPKVSVISAVGSGDAFFAGLLTALSEDCPMPEALRRAVAAGTANSLSVVGGQFTIKDYQDLLAATSLRSEGQR